MKINLKRVGGFTLVEILMCVVILGIAAATVLPQLTGRNDIKTAAAARIAMADLLYAQSRAISMQQTHYVQFSTASQQYALETSLSPATYVIHPVNKTNYITQFSTFTTNSTLKDVTLLSTSFDGNPSLAFDSLGSPLSVTTAGVASPLLTQGTIVLKAGVTTLTVTVEAYTGEINVH